MIRTNNIHFANVHSNALISLPIKLHSISVSLFQSDKQKEPTNFVKLIINELILTREGGISQMRSQNRNIEPFPINCWTEYCNLLEIIWIAPFFAQRRL